MIRDAIAKLVERQNLTKEEARTALVEILRGEATPAQIAAFVTALRMKGETVEEMVGAALAMREHMIRVQIHAPVVLDTCGTGGDGKGTFNVSTVTAFVVAAAGVTVAKHGNRAASSKCGSADLLEALGVKLDPPKDLVEACLQKLGIAFLMAPLYHPALKHAGAVRKEIGFRTLFNLLGPLCNPAGATHQAMGVPRREFVELIAQALGRLGTKRSFVFHSGDGMDELSTGADNHVCETNGATLHAFTLTPEAAGLTRGKAPIAGGTPRDNARLALAVLNGEKGPYRDAVLLNAAACLVVAGTTSDFKAAAAKAAEAIDSGRALKKLKELVEMSNA